MKRLKNIVAIGACALLVSTAQAASINIENPSFENGWNNWVFYFAIPRSLQI